MSLNDSRGCSLCTEPGQELYEEFTIGYGRAKRSAVQYDYRSIDGELFSTMAPTLEEAIARRINWLRKKEQ